MGVPRVHLVLISMRSSRRADVLPARPCRAGCRLPTLLLPGERPLRQIGTLPRNLDPRVFGDHLLAQGMKARFDERPDGWLVWIYNEDQVARARAELETYLSQPDDPRFDEAGEAGRRTCGAKRRSSTGSIARTFAR